MLNMKKVLLAGAILTAFSAYAFAAEPVISNNVPASQAKIQAKVLDSDDENAVFCNQCGYYHHKNWHDHKKTRQQCLENAKKAMEQLSEDEREEVREFISDERKHRQKTRAKLEKMTPKQREAIYANMRLHHKNWHKHHDGRQMRNCPHYND